MTGRRVTVEIDLLVLDGCCAPRHAERVAAALTGELERLLRVRPPAAQDREIDVLDGELTLKPNAAPESIGRDAAAAVYRRLLS